MSILEQTLKELSKLQSQVEAFMDFLINIQKIMEDIKANQHFVLMEGITSEELDNLNQDRELEKACYFTARTQEIFANRICRILPKTLLRCKPDSL